MAWSCSVDQHINYVTRNERMYFQFAWQQQGVILTDRVQKKATTLAKPQNIKHLDTETLDPDITSKLSPNHVPLLTSWKSC